MIMFPDPISSSRKIKKRYVYEAIKLINKTCIDKQEDKARKVTDDHKFPLYCNSSQNNMKKRMPVLVFSKSLAFSEMQSYVARQDWKHALNLFLRLLNYSSVTEPLIWRYALIILLHSNNSMHLHQFLEQCIGSRNSNNSKLLKRLLLLPLKEENI